LHTAVIRNVVCYHLYIPSFRLTVYPTCFDIYNVLFTPRRYPYFDVVVGLAWSYDPESYAGGSVAAGRVSHAGQVKGDTDKKGYPGPPS
jgi:hypothetical protein